jgi:hypothetical protein
MVRTGPPPLVGAHAASDDNCENAPNSDPKLTKD